jgi:hypothetical protein
MNFWGVKSESDTDSSWSGDGFQAETYHASLSTPLAALLQALADCMPARNATADAADAAAAGSFE